MPSATDVSKASALRTVVRFPALITTAFEVVAAAAAAEAMGTFGGREGGGREPKMCCFHHRESTLNPKVEEIIAAAPLAALSIEEGAREGGAIIIGSERS